MPPKSVSASAEVARLISKREMYFSIIQKTYDLSRDVEDASSKQQFLFHESEAAVNASYALSEMIARHLNPFNDGDFIKECLIKAAEIVCPGNVTAFENQIKNRSLTFESFPIACDGTTDISGTAQLAVFLRACDSTFNIFDELLELIPMAGTTTGQDIFTCVFDMFQKFNLPSEKLLSVATDGAPSMAGKNKGFVALLKQKLNGVNGSNFYHTHCILYQEVLCSKIINMENVLSYMKKI
ncbi:general transcription factor II-I repeat domain-containing protein 2-like, partial [Ctenocephalides felis]|uniref:general transcription factor II-I repeat domain-containing protein 2-like n=1 Tax=Ctenocephalides felis TaxID=7515 RepID=UPI000E6E4A6C